MKISDDHFVWSEALYPRKSNIQSEIQSHERSVRNKASRVCHLGLHFLTIFLVSTCGSKAHEKLSCCFKEPFKLFLRDSSDYRVLYSGEPNGIPQLEGSYLTRETLWLRSEKNELRGSVEFQDSCHIRLSNDLFEFSSNLPVVVIENFAKGRIGEDRKIPAFFGIHQPIASRASILGGFEFSFFGEISKRGSSSASWPKSSFAIEAHDQSGNDKKVSLLGMPAESDWILSGRYECDRALLRNELMFHLSRDFGFYAPRTRFVELFVNTQGGRLNYRNCYCGVYSLTEKIKAGRRRVWLSEENDASHPKESGFIFKRDRPDPGDAGFSVGPLGKFYFVAPKENLMTEPEKKYLHDYLDEFGKALFADDWKAPHSGVHFMEYIDVDSWIAYHWLYLFPKNIDCLHTSSFFHKLPEGQRGGRLVAGPIWDFDRCADSADLRDDSPEGWDGAAGSTRFFGDQKAKWWGRALENPDFRQLHIDFWAKARGGIFSDEYVLTLIDEMASLLDFEDPPEINRYLGRSAAQRNFIRWSRMPPREGSHAAEVKRLKDWFRARGRWIDLQFTPTPKLSMGSGSFDHPIQPTFVDLDDKIYYTLDGSDPRLSGGGISPSAKTGPIEMIKNTCKVIARAKRGEGLTAWSGRIECTYVIGQAANFTNLKLVNFDSKPLPARTLAEKEVSDGASDFEFLELKNVSENQLELAGIEFVKGIKLTVTPSSSTLLEPSQTTFIVRNSQAFSARYPDKTDQIVGEFRPKRLDNSGETVCLMDIKGKLIFKIDIPPAKRASN